MPNTMYASNDIYGTGDGGGGYPPPGGVGVDIIIETIDLYDASNNFGFSGQGAAGEWVAGSFVMPFDKPIDLIGTLINSAPALSSLKIAIYDFFTGAKLGETGFYPATEGLPTDNLLSILPTTKGMSYFFCLWSQNNVVVKYKNGLQEVAGQPFARRSNGLVGDVPNNILSEGNNSPIFPYILAF